MSGHSKWATIKRQKGVNDQKRGQIFSKLARAISLAARQGADPESNFKLRLLMEKGHQANMPKENIVRAIKRGSGEIEGAHWEEVIYEGYGPEGVAVLVETATDNRNRTTSEIKNLFERGGGSMAQPGAVAFQFKRIGLITVAKKENADEQLLALIDLGAEDVEATDDAIEVYVKAEDLIQKKADIEKAGESIIDAEHVMKPLAEIDLPNKNKAEKVIRFVSALEDHDDVQKVYSNFSIPVEILKELNA